MENTAPNETYTINFSCMGRKHTATRFFHNFCLYLIEVDFSIEIPVHVAEKTSPSRTDKRIANNIFVELLPETKHTYFSLPNFDETAKGPVCLKFDYLDVEKQKQKVQK